MREPLSSPLASRAGSLALSVALSLFACSLPVCIPGAHAFNFTSVPAPSLQLNDLGRVAFAGNFDAISLYQYEGQSEQANRVNGALLSRYPNGVFAKIQNTDGDVKAMCLYQGHGIVVGGNFTSVDGTRTDGGVALINANNGSVTALPGLTGSINALYCDNNRDQVFAGGSFTGGGATNAIIWKAGWNSMPFRGFNGDVYSIMKTPNGKIVFGGNFNGVAGNATGVPQNNTQTIPIGSANLTAQTSSGRSGFTEPKNIVCKSDPAAEGSGSTWLLADNVAGFWRADFGFGFQPTKLRLHNTQVDGRGTRTWRYTALPDGGIMNFTYVDPRSGRQAYCDARCPLPQGNTTAQDFYFVNVVGMNSFRIDISEWYGSGGGLNAIELFQTSVFSYAINEFNVPKCGGATTGASATATGPWQITPSHLSNSQYLTATLETAKLNSTTDVVVFTPDIPQSGNYTIKMYTPGCRGDGTCGTRGRVNITGAMSKSRTPSSVVLYQTNEFDKYDVIYDGHVDMTDGFKPTVTLAPVAGQDPGSGVLTVVAQRVGFEIRNASSGNINGLFELDPDQQEVNAEDFSRSVINLAGASLSPSDGVLVSTLAADNSRLYIGGNFTSSSGLNNIFAIGKDASRPTPLQGGGLNRQVLTLFQASDALYVGGNFTNTQDNSNSALGGVAAYSNDQWSALGAGVNGVVASIVPISMNVTAGKPEDVLGISGFFDRVNGFGNNPSFAVDNFAVWVPSRGNWLLNLNVQAPMIQGRFMSFADVPGADRFYAGAVVSHLLGASGAAALQSGGTLALQSFAARIQAPLQSSGRKRSLTEGEDLTATGIYAAAFYKEQSMNKTILAGHFAATGSNGQNISNVAIIDGKNSDYVTGFGEGVDSNSTFAALAVLGNVVFAGGVVSGQINGNRIAGIVAYDHTTSQYAGTQPPGLQGTNVTVNAIAPRPKSQDVYVGGQFQSAGPLSCPSLCVWNTERNQWTPPGGGISGTVTSLFWIADTKLIISGNLTVGSNQTKVATFDSSSRQFQSTAGAGDLPGVVTALAPANSDGSQMWAAGKASDGSAFIQRFDGGKWNAIGVRFEPGTTIQGVQVLPLSRAHQASNMIDANQALLVLGHINITNFGTASGALYDGTTLTPFLLSSTNSGESGSLSQVFVENPQFFFSSGGKKLAVGFIVLIALAIALALTFLLVVAGILTEYMRKRKQGYAPAPTSYTERMGNVGRVPPEQLFGTLSSTPRAPAI